MAKAVDVLNQAKKSKLPWSVMAQHEPAWSTSKVGWDQCNSLCIEIACRIISCLWNSCVTYFEDGGRHGQARLALAERGQSQPAGRSAARSWPPVDLWLACIAGGLALCRRHTGAGTATLACDCFPMV